MKTYKWTIACLWLLLAAVACKKGDTGPAGERGPAGEQGPRGPQGMEGNANARQYNFGPQNFSSIIFAQLQITTTQDTMDNATWLVYLYNPGNSRWYFIPGYGVGGNTQYRVSMGYISGKVNLYIDKTGSGENYSKARVIRIYNGKAVSASLKPGAPASLDLQNYDAVSAWYKLKPD